jgi:hypothetical protein
VHCHVNVYEEEARNMRGAKDQKMHAMKEGGNMRKKMLNENSPLRYLFSEMGKEGIRKAPKTILGLINKRSFSFLQQRVVDVSSSYPTPHQQQ